MIEVNALYLGIAIGVVGTCAVGIGLIICIAVWQSK